MRRDDKDQTERDKDSSHSFEEIDQEDLDDREKRPVLNKRGEGPDNLRRRSAWFQKRTGGGEQN